MVQPAGCNCGPSGLSEMRAVPTLIASLLGVLSEEQFGSREGNEKLSDRHGLKERKKEERTASLNVSI